MTGKGKDASSGAFGRISFQAAASTAALTWALALGGAAYANEAAADTPMLLAQADAQPQQPTQGPAPQPQPQAQLQGEADDDIVVTGIRASLESAVDTKRNAVVISDSISAEGIGRFPDLNLGEAVQRITGVQIIRDEFRSGRVSIRGLPSKFSQTQVNGQFLASPNYSDGFVFGVFEANVISGVDVFKTPAVFMDEGGLSGIVNLRTRRALEFEGDSHFYISADGVYEELAESWAPEVAFSAGRRFMDGRLGAYITGAYQRQDFRTDAARISSYLGVDTNADGVRDLFVPNDFRFNARAVEGDRVSAAAGVEWRPNDEWDINFTALYSRYDVEQPLHEIRVSNIGAYTVLDSLSDPTFGTTATQVRYTGPRVQNQNRINDEAQDTWAATLDAEWERGPWNVSGAVHVTEGSRDRFFVQVIRRIDNNANNGVTVNLNTGGEDPYGFTFSMTPDPANFFSFTNSNPRLSTQIIPDASLRRWERQWAAQLDVERDFDWAIFESIQAGVKFRHNEQENEDRRMSATGANLAILNDAYFMPSLFGANGGFFQGELAYQNFPVLDAGAVLQAILPINTTQPLSPEGFILNPDFNNLYNNKQDITAGYLQANFGFDLGPIGVRGNTGVRYVQTDRTAEALVRINGVLTEANIPTEFENVLPQTNLIFDLTDDLIFRLSWADTIVRPDPQQFRAARAVTLQSDAVTGELISITSTTNNANLLPFDAESFDASLEWYNRPGSNFHVAYFHKTIAGDVVRQADCPLTVPGVEHLITGTPRVVGNQCLDEAGVEIIQNTQFNSPETFEVSGIEVGTTQNFDFLPGFLGNFGFTANYTYIDASESGDFDASGNPQPLPEISEHSANLILYYETESFGARLAYNYRSEFFVTSAGTFLGDDRYVDARDQIDLSLSYNVNENFRLGFEAFNLTDQDRFEYQGTTSRFRDLNNMGRTYTLSASYEY